MSDFLQRKKAVGRGAAKGNAVNAPIQGSAADIVKLAMIRVHHRIQSENWAPKCFYKSMTNWYLKSPNQNWLEAH